MNPSDRRRHPRVETNNLFAHKAMDRQGDYLSQGMGKAIDVSQSGIKLETSYPIDGNRVSLMSAAMDDRLIEIVCEKVYSRRVKPDTYHIGLEFIGSEDEIKTFVTELVRLRQQRKHDTYVRIAA